MARYGFELRNGHLVEAEAATIQVAMAEVESREGSPVSRGRCLDDFNNESSENRPWYLEHRTRPPTIPTRAN